MIWIQQHDNSSSGQQSLISLNVIISHINIDKSPKL